MSRQVIVCLALVAGLLGAAVAQEDYCDSSLCDPGVQHIGCNAKNELSPDCNEGKKIELTDELKKLILDEHNNYRNQVAKGELNWLPTASNMVTMDWDDDLAYLAELNADRCEFEHDQCHNTKKYPNSGQNIASWATSGDSYEVKDTIKTLIQEWWDERHFAGPKLVKKLWGKYKALHFTMLTRSNASRLGCAMVQYKQTDFLWVLLICNYSYTNMIGTSIYKEGAPCSDCKSGCDSKYDGLCNKDEAVDVA
ncbi:antigen 5 like allergen Cul n 1 [Aedes albopictus]|uniref:SCP domain-containing protein n=1 Tax=Aedes albopictus TaxID=7160 RepID=A0ABM1ZJU3_AEDAL|nr:scoloptoxin SSD976-like [Aedes albopictus]